MIYEYECSFCEKRFDVVKPSKDYDKEERCAKCDAVATRKFVPAVLYFSGTKVQEAEYNPGLGCIVKNKQHRAEICKARGLEEIGSEKVETVEKHFKKAREDKWEKSWADADKGWVGAEG